MKKISTSTLIKIIIFLSLAGAILAAYLLWELSQLCPELF